MANKYTEDLNKTIAEAIKILEIKEGWNVIKSENGLTHSIIQYGNQSKFKLCKLSGTIPVNYEKAARYYLDRLDLVEQCRPMVEFFKSIEDIDKDTAVTFAQTKKSPISGPVAILGAMHVQRLSENSMICVRCHLDSHPNAPRSEEVVRGHGYIFACIATKINEQSSQVDILLQNDLNIDLPEQTKDMMSSKFIEGMVADTEKMKTM